MKTLKTRNLITATVLSVGLIFGSMGAAGAESTTPAAATYAEQIAAYKVAMDEFKVAREAKRNEIINSFKRAIKEANVALTSAIKAAKTSDQRNAAKAAFSSAISAAASARTSALDALSSAFVAPAKPTAPAKPPRVDKNSKKIK